MKSQSGFYLFSSGVTHLVVQILSVEDGQATCKIYRRLEEWWKHKTKAEYAKYAQWLHTQPGPGKEIILPFEMLRPCNPAVKLMQPIDYSPGLSHEAMGAFALLLIALFIAMSCWSSEYQKNLPDATTKAELAQKLDSAAETAERKEQALETFKTLHSYYSWNSWKKYYYKTGRTEKELIDDVYFDGKPALETGTDTDCQRLDIIEHM